MPSVCKILPLKCSPRWSCEQLSSWETRNYIWLQSALSDLTHFPFSYEYYLQPAWIRRCCPCSYRYVIAKEVLSCICQKMKDWGFIKLDGLVGTPSCQVGARTFDRALLSCCKGCQRLLKVSTKYRQSYASVPGKGHFRSGLKSLGRTVWGILLGICPQDSHLQSVLIFGSFRVASSTHKKDVKKVRTGIFPCYIHPSTIKFRVCTSKQLPNQENHTTRIYFSFWDQLIPYALQGLFQLLILAWQDARGFRVQLTALSWQDGYTEPFAGTWKKEWETLSALELFKITLRVLLADSSAPAGSNCIMLEQKARHSTAGGRGV